MRSTATYSSGAFHANAAGPRLDGTFTLHLAANPQPFAEIAENAGQWEWSEHKHGTSGTADSFDDAAAQALNAWLDSINT